MTEGDLKHLTKYTASFCIQRRGPRKLEPRKLWQRFEAPIGDVVTYAEQRVPEMVKDTLRRIGSER